MLSFKFKDNNYNSNEYGYNSHELSGNRKKSMDKFITFDSESNSKYYYQNKEISYEEYEQLETCEKHKVFYLKIITASFVKNKKIKNITYILKPSIYFKKDIYFQIKIFDKDVMIHSKVKYFDNEYALTDQFYNDIDKFIKKSKENIRVFCHNGKHDWMQCKTFSLYKSHNWELQNFRFTTPKFVTYSLSRKRKVIFLDTVNYFQTKLEVLGEEVGIHKKKENVDFSKEIKITQQFLEYGIVDTLILAYKLVQFNDQVSQYGTIGFGIASTAYSIWRTSFLKEKIWLHKNKCLTRIERLSYFGGRTEAFKLGYFKNVNAVDINSQYPYQMTKKLPVRYIQSLRALTDNDSIILLRKFHELKNKYCLLCEIQVNSTLKIPVIPYKYNSKLLFINGKIDCVLAQPEIELLLTHNEQIKIKGIHIYKAGYPMREFSKVFYEFKQKYKGSGEKALETFFKLILNSSYGKTGEREIEEITRSCDKNLVGKIIEIVKGREFHFSCLSGLMKASKFKDNDAKNAFCIIASFITSYARSYLYKAFYQLGFDNILYCDTDSIYTTLPIDQINKLLPIDDLKLGYFGYDYKNVDMLIYGVKDYIILKDGKTIKQKLKGISLKNSHEISENDWICERWTSLSYGIKINDMEHQNIINIKKELSREYTKAKLVNPEHKNIIVDKVKRNYLQSDLKHFDIKELTPKKN